MNFKAGIVKSQKEVKKFKFEMQASRQLGRGRNILQNENQSSGEHARKEELKRNYQKELLAQIAADRQRKKEIELLKAKQEKEDEQRMLRELEKENVQNKKATESRKKAETELSTNFVAQQPSKRQSKNTGLNIQCSQLIDENNPKLNTLVSLNYVTSSKKSGKTKDENTFFGNDFVAEKMQEPSSSSNSKSDYPNKENNRFLLSGYEALQPRRFLYEGHRPTESNKLTGGFAFNSQIDDIRR